MWSDRAATLRAADAIVRPGRGIGRKEMQEGTVPKMENSGGPRRPLTLLISLE